jgi:hypothetical protein
LDGHNSYLFFIKDRIRFGSMSAIAVDIIDDDPNEIGEWH